MKSFAFGGRLFSLLGLGHHYIQDLMPNLVLDVRVFHKKIAGLLPALAKVLGKKASSAGHKRTKLWRRFAKIPRFYLTGWK